MRYLALLRHALACCGRGSGRIEKPIQRIALIGLVALAACTKPQGSAAAPEGGSAAPAGPAVKVETATVQKQKMPKYLTLTGSVLADKQSDLAANVSGRVHATYVERGQPVKKGQPIAA